MRALGLMLLLAPAPATADGCRIAGCVQVPQTQRSAPAYAVGDTLPRGAFSMLMNAPYHGLPRAQGGWVYFKVGRDVMRVDLDTMTVLDIVTGDVRNLR